MHYPHSYRSRGTRCSLVIKANGPATQSYLVKKSERGKATGVDGFVLYGTTGESTLSISEKESLTKVARESFETPQLPKIIDNNTMTTCSFAQQVHTWGADAGLLVTPYYNRPSQEGLYRHTLTVAEAVPDLL